MGGNNSKPSCVYSYNDNSSQINQSLSQIKKQINELNSDLDKFKVSIDTHVITVQKKFANFDHKILQIQNEFQESFNFVNQGILMIGNNIDSMSKYQIEYESSNNKEHWEIQQNEWKENFERNIYQQFQKLKNIKFELELDLHKKVGSYLLIKDKFNDQIKIYQEKKSQYQITNLQSQMLFLLNHIVTKSDSVDLVQFNQIDNLVEKSNLDILENTIQFLPELDEGIVELYLITDKFEEIIKTETKLKENINLMIENFSNPNLSNPLDNLNTSPEIFATKLYNSGIKSINQIEFSNQTQILISNGFAYIPEYKYKDLKKKFICGCEKSNLKLNWQLENINWISAYLYEKIQTKSINSMIEYVCSNKCIYPIECIQNNNLAQIGLVGLKLWEGLTNKSKNNLELVYETNPIILYNIFVLNNKINDTKLITNKMVGDLGYKQLNDFTLLVLQYQLYQIDKNEIFGNQVLKNDSFNFDIELQNIIGSNSKLYNNLVTWVVSEYIYKKKSDSNFTFEFGQTNSKLFFDNIISVLLYNYIEFQMNTFTQTNMTSTYFDHKLFFSTQNIKFNEFVNSILVSNKFEDTKIFISFIFSKIYDFYWQFVTI